MPVHQFVHDATLHREGPAQLLGLQHDRLLRAAQRVQPRRGRRPAGPGVQGDGARPARGRHRGDPRRGLQPHRRGQPHGPDAVVPGHRQRAPTTGWSRTTAATTWTTPAPATASTSGTPQSLQLIMDSLRYWVTEMHVDGFRFDLGVHPGPRVARRRPAVDLLRPRPAGPGGQPGQADRRALGRRRGRLPGGQLPAAVDGVERQVPRHRPRLLARRGRHARRVRRPVYRLADLYEHSGRRPVASDQLRHRPRRLHPERPGLLQREAQRGQRRGQQRRREPQPVWNCGVEGPTDDPEILELRAQQQRNFIATLLLSARACRCCCTATSSAAPSGATTTATARTTSSPGSTGRTPTRACSSSPQAVDRAAHASTRPSAVAGSSTAAPVRRGPGRPGARHRLVHARRASR